MLAAGPPVAAAAGWLAPTELSAPGRDATAVSVGMDDAGNSAVLWQRARVSGPGTVIQASTRAAGSAFSAPFELSPSGNEPVLAMSPGGEAIAVWRELDTEIEEVSGEEFINTSSQVLRASVKPPGQGFSPPFEVYRAPPTIIKVVDSVPTTERHGATPQGMRLAIGPLGQAVLAWTENDPEEPAATVMASVRAAGGGFSPATRVSPAPVSMQLAERPEVAIDQDGDTTVVWQYFDGERWVVQAATGPPGGDPGSMQTITDDLVGEEAAEDPVVGVDAAGNAVAAWRWSDPDEARIEVAARAAGGNFGEPETLSETGEDSVFSPEIAINADGEAVVVWLADEATTETIVAQGGSDGEFGAPVPVSTEDEDANYARTTINAAGSVAVSWSNTVGGVTSLAASVRPASGAFASPAQISPTDSEILQSDLAMDAFGDVTAGWYQSTGGNRIARVAGYDAFVPELRGLSIPTQGLVGEQLAFSVAPFDVWPVAPATFAFGDGTTVSGSAVAHAFSAPGSYEVVATVVDAAGNAKSQSGVVTIRARSDFSIGKRSLNKKKGTGKLAVTVGGPGTVSVRGKGVKAVSVNVAEAGLVKVPVRAVGKWAKKLRKKGKLKLKLTVTFAPKGGDPAAKQAGITLRKAKPKKHG
jgi:hypothetical protein